MTENVSDTSRRRRCVCGGELRFSHRAYAGRGAENAVFRCPACGRMVTVPVPRDARSERHARRSRKQPVDEGPPENPVIDPEAARRLLGG